MSAGAYRYFEKGREVLLNTTLGNRRCWFQVQLLAIARQLGASYLAVLRALLHLLKGKIMANLKIVYGQGIKARANHLRLPASETVSPRHLLQFIIFMIWFSYYVLVFLLGGEFLSIALILDLAYWGV